MRFGVDGRSLTAHRGVARTTRGALAALARAHPQDEWRCLVPGTHPVDPVDAANVVLVRDRRPGRLLHGAAAVVGRPRLDTLLGGGLDAVWLPAPAPVALTPGVPFVLTVHDLSWEERPQDFTAYERLWHRAARPRRLARAASVVAAVSQATADRVERVWGVEPARMVLAPPGTDGGPAPTPSPARPRPFLLFVGALEPRKGVDVLAGAWAQARRDGLDADLVVVGDGREASRLDGLPGVVRVLAAREADLRALLRDALCLVAPSRLEGFGLVPLEAAVQGTAAIVSDLDAFRETLGDDAVFVPAGDAAALAGAMVALAGDEERRARLAHAAGIRAVRYTWAATATALGGALRRAAGT